MCTKTSVTLVVELEEAELILSITKKVIWVESHEFNVNWSRPVNCQPFGEYQHQPGRGVSEKVSAVGFCLGSGLFGSCNSN